MFILEIIIHVASALRRLKYTSSPMSFFPAAATAVAVAPAAAIVQRSVCSPTFKMAAGERHIRRQSPIMCANISSGKPIIQTLNRLKSS